MTVMAAGSWQLAIEPIIVFYVLQNSLGLDNLSIVRTLTEWIEPNLKGKKGSYSHVYCAHVIKMCVVPTIT